MVIRLRLVHGHFFGARRAWKALMESRAFFEGFGHVPGADRPRDGSRAWPGATSQGSMPMKRRHLRRLSASTRTPLRGSVDLVVIGHVHRPVDDGQAIPRLIVLGGWQHRTSYLKIDSAGASLSCRTRRRRRFKDVDGVAATTPH